MHREGQHIFFQFASSCLHSSIETFHADYTFLGRSGSNSIMSTPKKKGQEPLLVLAVLRRAARHWEALFLDCSQLLLNATPTVWRRSIHFKAVWCVPCSSQKLSCWKARPACNGVVGSLKHCKPSRSSWPWKDCHGASPCKGNRTTFV